MKILIAPDKFKHSLSSMEVCTAIKNGLLKAAPDLEITLLPLADGGDGLSDVINHYHPSKEHYVQASDPLFRPISSSLQFSKDGKTAFIEMAKASGLSLLKPDERNCMYTTSLGTGDLIKEAMRLGAGEIILGIGGSATNDCGIGMATALGYRFLDRYGLEINPIGCNLIKIMSIDSSKVSDFTPIKFTVACDVSNPLCGENGAAKTYARQKGASQSDINMLEEGMLHFSELLHVHFSKNVKALKGAGAAGGMGAGCAVFLNGALVSGIDLVLKLSNAEHHIRNSDLVITGEGKIDEQTLHGKVISGLSMLSRASNKPLIAFCGSSELTKSQIDLLGLQKVFPITPENLSLEQAYLQARSLLTQNAYLLGQSLISI